MLHAFGRFFFEFGVLAIGWMHSGLGSSAQAAHSAIVHTMDCGVGALH